jgi:lipoate-protein ligase A
MKEFIIEEVFDRPGLYHMRRDEELVLRARDSENFQPVLRLYSWKPYAISLGYQQSDEEIDREACAREGVEVVRRPTGGRAVYHSEELTYAVILRHEPNEGIYAVHNRIAQMLLDALQPLCGGKLELTSKRSGEGIRNIYKDGLATNIACFASSARYEITYEGKKVVGSAQRRFGNAVLQHGSILLGNEHLRLGEFLRIPDEEKTKMKELLSRETATLSDICGRNVSIEEAAEEFRIGMRQNGYRISSETRYPRSENRIMLPVERPA